MTKSGCSPSVVHSLPYILGWVWLSIMGPMFAIKLFSKVARSIISRYCLSKDKLAGKVVIVTGASSGVGEELCRVLYKRGCRLIMAARSVDKLNTLTQELISSCQTSVVREPIVLELDISDLKSIPEKMRNVLKRVGGSVDILINNAGQSYRGETVSTLIDVDLKLMLVNYFGHVAITKEVLPGMISCKSGHIVSIGSFQGRLALPYRTSYSASKHALQGYMDSLRSEVSHYNIIVSMVSPGYIATNLSVNALTGDGENYGKVDETTSSGMQPSYVASRIERLIDYQDEDLLLVPFHYKIALLMRLCTPGVLNYFLKRRAQKGVGKPSDRKKL